MESEKKFGLLKFGKKLTIFIKEIVDENELFQDLKTIENMKSFVDLSLSQLNVTKISKDKFRVDIQILIEPNQKELTITLLESKGFENIDSLNTKENINLNSNNQNLQSSSYPKNQKIIYTENYHFDKKSKNCKDLYYELKNRVLNEYRDIEALPSKMYIGFKLKDKFKGSTIISVKPMREGLKIVYNASQGDLDDYLNKTRDVSAVGHLGQGDYELKITNRIEIDYAMELTQQTYENRIRKIMK